jgi:hypothetical protein
VAIRTYRTNVVCRLEEDYCQPLHFLELGELGAQSDKAVDDGCRASCVDWYGNSRPLFVRGRVLALLGYEIVEGSLKDGRMRETRRINYAPSAVTRGD